MMVKRKSTNNDGLEIFINVGPVEKRIAIVNDGVLMDFFLEREGLEHYAGSIYKGKITSIIKGIEASFVDIGMEKNAFLHVGDIVANDRVLREMLSDDYEALPKKTKRKRTPKISDIVSVGKEIMAQVIKEAISTKGPRITTFVSIPGRYIVLTPYDSHIGISRRIKDKEKRSQIREMLENILGDKKVGLIVRTMAEGITEKELKEEIKYLLNQWDMIKTRYEQQKDTGVVYEEYGAILRMVRDRFTDEVSKLVVDSKEEYARIIKFLKAFRPELRKKVKLHRAKTPLFYKYDLERQISMIFERRVPLKSGGDIVIEQTEGLVAIDVNTGKFKGKVNLEETAFKTNMEAAREIPRQIMLRDIGGIIIIDFIDMSEKKHRDKVFSVLQHEIRHDKARISLRSISPFGIVEMTRQRMRKSLESTSHRECPYCGGKGVIKSSATIALETVREIDSVLSSIKERKKHIVVTTHPEVNVALMHDQAKMLSDIQKKYRCRIDLIEDMTAHREQVSIRKQV